MTSASMRTFAQRVIPQRSSVFMWQVSSGRSVEPANVIARGAMSSVAPIHHGPLRYDACVMERSNEPS